MDILIFMAFAGLFLAMAMMSKRVAWIGFVAGVGLIMLSLTIQTEKIQVASGFNSTVVNNLTTQIVTYQPIQTVFPGISTFFLTVLTIVVGAAGLLILLNEVAG